MLFLDKNLLYIFLFEFQLAAKPIRSTMTMLIKLSDHCYSVANHMLMKFWLCVWVFLSFFSPSLSYKQVSMRLSILKNCPQMLSYLDYLFCLWNYWMPQAKEKGKKILSQFVFLIWGWYVIVGSMYTYIFSGFERCQTKQRITWVHLVWLALLSVHVLMYIQCLNVDKQTCVHKCTHRREMLKISSLVW